MINRRLWKTFIEGACGGNIKGIEAELPLYLAMKEEDPLRIDINRDFSLLELWEALGGDESLERLGQGIREEGVSVAQFPVITGLLLSKKIMDAYNASAMVLDQLVTDFPSRLLVDRIPGAETTAALEDIEAGMPYPETADIQEKYVTVEGKKRGEILNVTWEAVHFDQTGLILRQANAFGEQAAKDREQRGLKTIMDMTDYQKYQPSGTQDDLYQNAAGSTHHVYDNLVVDVLADHSDINAAEILLGSMMDANGYYINTGQTRVLLTGVNLKQLAWRIQNNTFMIGGTNEEMNPAKGTFGLVVSPWVSANSTTAWWYGDFKKQFVEKVVLPMQVITRKDNINESAFKRDILASHKVRHYTQVAAVDYKYVVKSTGAGS